MLAATVAIALAVGPPANAQTRTSAIVFHTDRDGDYEIYTMADDGADQTNISDDAARDRQPSICPRGDEIAFESDRDAEGTTGAPQSYIYGDIFVMDPDGGAPVNVTDSTDLWETEPDCGRIDGTNVIVFQLVDDMTPGAYPFELWTINADGTDLDQLTYTISGVVDKQPTWCGDKVVFASNRPTGGDYDIWEVDADGGNLQYLTGDYGVDEGNPECSPDLKHLVFDRVQPEESTLRDVILWSFLDESEENLSGDEVADDAEPSWSPGGTQVAFASDREGNFDIYKTLAFPTVYPGTAVPLSSNSDRDERPDWGEVEVDP